jgi:hypothetical protein
MNIKLHKVVSVLLMGGLLFGVSRLQRSLNDDRERLGLTRTHVLDNAPPVLAFTTVALGGFRGLISNILWIRASELQDQDKFFEMAQLADWITKLEPHYVQVWLNQAWNMAYNISVKFKDFPDRWRWVKRGVELLRDQGLKYNPNEMLIYRELAWFFQHKMGQNLDDANMTYKQEWADEMAVVFDKKKPNLDELINPQTDDQRARAKLLREKYKMDPVLMKEVDERYGPLEWRLPEAHAIYWAELGLKAAAANPTKIKKEDLITLRRVIYQSMQMSFRRGRLVANPFLQRFEFGPNLDIIPKVSDSYLEMAKDEPNMKDNILRGHRNFLRDAVYFLYSHNRLVEAAKWYKYLGEQYPEFPLLDGRPETLPKNLTLDSYVVARLQEDVKETDRDRIRNVIEGLLVNSYLSLAIDEDEKAAGYKLLARKVWDTYQSKLIPERYAALTLPPLAEIDKDMQARVLDPEQGIPVEARAVIRTRLGLPAESTNAPPASVTNSVPAAVTNAAPAPISSK